MPRLRLATEIEPTMRAKRKADYHHGNLRRALIDAAVSAIAKHGVDALNLRQLAARAGVTPGRPIITSPTAKSFSRRSRKRDSGGSRQS